MRWCNALSIHTCVWKGAICIQNISQLSLQYVLSTEIQVIVIFVTQHAMFPAGSCSQWWVLWASELLLTLCFSKGLLVEWTSVSWSVSWHVPFSLMFPVEKLTSCVVMQLMYAPTLLLPSCKHVSSACALCTGLKLPVQLSHWCYLCMQGTSQSEVRL